MNTPLSDEMQALLAYANETTEGADSTLGDAVKTLCDGYMQGGGGYVAERCDIRDSVVFMDYDGTIIASCSLSEAHNLTALPSLPDTERLTFQGWTHTLAEVRAFAYPTFVFANYMPKSGCTELHLHQVSNPVYIDIELKSGETMTVDWGDGTVVDFTGARTGWVQHSYTESKGKRLVKIRHSHPLRMNQIHASAYLVEANFADSWVIRNICNYSKIFLQFSMPLNGEIDMQNVTQYGFWENSLKCIPVKTYRGIGLNGGGFWANWGIFKDITTIDQPLALGIHGRIVIPTSITAIATGKQIFTGNLGTTLVFLQPTPYTLSGNYMISEPDAVTRIFVPDASVEAYKTAQYWSSYADKIYPLSELD